MKLNDYLWLNSTFCQEVIDMLADYGAREKYGLPKASTRITLFNEATDFGEGKLKLFYGDRRVTEANAKYRSLHLTMEDINVMINDNGLRSTQVLWEMQR